MKIKKNEVAVYALGGLDEIGKNTYCVEYKDEIIVIDAGISFPGDSLLGVEYVLADYTHLIENKEKIQCLIITHGHEDHIGGISYMLKQIPSLSKIYAPPLAASLIKKKVSSAQLSAKKDLLEMYDEEKVITTKNMKVEFFRTNHSIPDSFGLAITTPEGTIVHTGDFKFDLTPVGEPANIGKMATIGNEGVLCLLSDSTNTESKGFTPSERVVDKSLRDLFKKNEGRIIVATFASNLHRLSHIIETCIKSNRKIALAGRSMENIIKVAMEQNRIPNIEKHLISINNMKNYDDREIAVLCTGSQGEPLAALSRISNGTHKQIKLQQGDTVIFSSSPIPGNGIKISRTINLLFKKGAKVFTNRDNNIHTSGHGAQGELQLMLRLMRPKYFMPIHGEYRMLKIHSELAMETGVAEENCFVLENGDVLALTKDSARVADKVSGKDIYIDGKLIGDVEETVLNDRKILIDDGLIAVSTCIDIKERKLISQPMIQTRGFVKANENEDLMNKIKVTISKEILMVLKDPKVTFDKVKRVIINSSKEICNQETGRNPIILPIMMNIKDSAKYKK